MFLNYSICPLQQPLLHVVLDRPRIAANIASIVRLCAGVGAALHVCGPLVFETMDKTRWRAGLDYFAGARIHFHLNADRCLEVLGKQPWIVEVGSSQTLWDAQLQLSDVVVLGPETGNAVPHLVSRWPNRVLTLPQTEAVRCLNLAQCAAVVCFEAMRQNLKSV
ncbi:MAG: TrmH family RNA methyltransferase [Myxococcota bacterium]